MSLASFSLSPGASRADWTRRAIDQVDKGRLFPELRTMVVGASTMRWTTLCDAWEGVLRLISFIYQQVL
jgi:hypothetical protein